MKQDIQLSHRFCPICVFCLRRTLASNGKHQLLILPFNKQVQHRSMHSVSYSSTALCFRVLTPQSKCRWLVLVLSYRMCLMFLKWNKIMLQTSPVCSLAFKQLGGIALEGFSIHTSEEKKKPPFSFPNLAGSSQSHQGKCFSLLLQDQARNWNPFSSYRNDETTSWGWEWGGAALATWGSEGCTLTLASRFLFSQLL